MLLGEFEPAWQHSDALRMRNSPDPHRFWQGEAIVNKRIIVRCLHGFGDAVQMLRYAPMLAERAAHVVYEVPPRMVAIARCFYGVDDVITWGEDAPSSPPEWDVQIEVMELPYVFRTVEGDLPIAKRYVDVPLPAMLDAANRMGERKRRRVGVVWSAGKWNPERSIPFQLLVPVLRNPKIEFWSLQGLDAAPPAEDWWMHDQVAITGDGILPLAATIANLDLVITVDTLAAHLAGALDVPALLLLQHAADWRWMHNRVDSPWYRSLTLIRQEAAGDWESVMSVVEKKLAGTTA